MRAVYDHMCPNRMDWEPQVGARKDIECSRSDKPVF